MKSSLLISWIALYNDYDAETGEITPFGPTLTFHRLHFSQGEHLLLYSDKSHQAIASDLKKQILASFPDRKVSIRLASIPDILDLPQIKAKVESILLEFSQREIDIFFSPGAPMMQVAWYICHVGLGLKTRLLQLRKPQDSPNAQKPELLELKVTEDIIPRNTILKEHRFSQVVDSPNYHLTSSMKKTYERAYLAAQTDQVTVLISGHSGTGKEYLARYIHDHSPRKHKDFIAINCSAFSDQLLESRLFGYKKGAFTGAEHDQKGLFQQAEGGTIFLDEIGDITPYMQQVLLRVIQEKEVLAVGSTVAEATDVRVIAATNKDLIACCEAQTFRWDLYYRLAIVELELPALMECHVSEIESWLEYFLEKKALKFGRPQALQLKEAARKVILTYPFPGNIREMENLVENLYVFCQKSVSREDLPSRLFRKEAVRSLRWKDVEKNHLQRVYAHFEGNQSRMKEALGYGSINTLKSKLKEYGILAEKEPDPQN